MRSYKAVLMTCGKKNGRCKCSRWSTRGSAGSCEENEDRGRTRRKRTNIRARRARGFQAPRSSASGRFTPRRPRENQGKSTATGNNAPLAPGDNRQRNQLVRVEESSCSSSCGSAPYFARSTGGRPRRGTCGSFFVRGDAPTAGSSRVRC